MGTPSFEFADAPAQVRQKKAALLEVIELQRTYIERGYPSAGGHGAATEEAEEAEMRWYTEQASRLEKFKAALNAIRLQPDEFPLLVPEHWASRGEAPAASRELVPYTLRINARSQLTFVPIAPPTARAPAEPADLPPPDISSELVQLSSHQSSSGSDDVGSGLLLGGGLGAARVVFMDAVRQVRIAQQQPEAHDCGGGSGSGVLLSATPAHVGAANALPPPSPSGVAPRTLTVELFGEPAVTIVAPEASELVEVLGAHLRRYNTSRVAQVRALQQLHSLKCTPYDPREKQHVELLTRLWACAFGADSKCALVSDRWIHLGFQSSEPAKDFRGMGILGLANLVYFGEHYADVFQRLVAAQRKRDYPLACAGINITSLLLELLNMRDEGEPETVQSRPPFDGEWSCDMFHFFCHMFCERAPPAPRPPNEPALRPTAPPHAPASLRPLLRRPRACLRGHVLLLPAVTRPHVRPDGRRLRRLQRRARRAARPPRRRPRAAAALLPRVQTAHRGGWTGLGGLRHIRRWMERPRLGHVRHDDVDGRVHYVGRPRPRAAATDDCRGDGHAAQAPRRTA